jgi:DNA-binding transcriptional ArsR family regulator
MPLDDTDTSSDDATPDDATSDDAYADGAALALLLGDGPKVRMLSALLAEPDFDHTVTEIADLAGVSRNTVYRHLDDLLELGVVVETRETGGSPRYQIDRGNPAAEKLAALEWTLIDLAFEEE